MPLLTGCASGVEYQRPPLQTVSGTCGKLADQPDEYADCAQMVRVGNQMREDAWQGATARNEQQSAPTFAPDPSLYTLHTQPPLPPPQTPTADLNLGYLPPQPYNGAPGYGDVGGYAGHVNGGPDVYVIPPGSGP
jgi:hypothetical protein